VSHTKVAQLLSKKGVISLVRAFFEVLPENVDRVVVSPAIQKNWYS
jgi:hypothetical protein